MRLLLLASLAVVLLLQAPVAWAQSADKTDAGAPPAAASSAPAATSAPTASPAPTAAAPPASPTPAPAPAPAKPKELETLTSTTSPAPAATTTAAKPAQGTGGTGLSPNLPSNTGGTPVPVKEAQALSSSTTSSSANDEWRFEFHGYLRAPLRMSIGPPTPVVPPSGFGCGAPNMGTPPPAVGMGNPTGCTGPPQTMVPTTAGLNGKFPYYNTNAGSNPNVQFAGYAPGVHPTSGTQFHEVPRVAGYGYYTWKYTNTVPGPWTQLNFSYGNSRVMANVIVDAFDQTDGGYANLLAQQGIDQAFLTLNFPDFFGDYGGLVWNVGSFQNRYGTAGKYDGGMYETYLFGRTHQVGETLTANLSNLDPSGAWQFTLEDGFGGKIDVIPFFQNQFYQVFSNSSPNVGVGSNNGKAYLSQPDAQYFPWAGSVPQGSTFIHHAHLGAKYQNLLTFGLHYLYAWTPDDNWDPINSTLPDASDLVPRSRGPIQGSLAVTGGEVRLNGGVMGDGYVGYSHIDARNINALAPILEVLHSNGGASFKQTYFGQTFNAHTGYYTGPENETGTVDSVLFQYSFSFGKLARYPEDFWGDGPDLVATIYGLFTIVNSKPPPIAVTAVPNLATQWDMSTKKLKYGADLTYTPLSVLGFNGRFDMVMPDLDSAYNRTPFTPGGSDLNFSVLTARAIVKTQFVTHEAVVLEYQHYFLGPAAYAAYPYQWLPQADPDLLSISASMWW